MKEVIGARQMRNGQVKVYFSGDETEQRLTKQQDWVVKLSLTAHIASPTFQVLVHDMPLSFDPEKREQIKELESTNRQYLRGLEIKKASGLKKIGKPNKNSGSLIVWCDKAEQADVAIRKGIMWRYQLKATEIFRSGFRLMQCLNCQTYGHIARNCTAIAKCGNCAEKHNTRECTGKKEVRCCNRSRKFRAWDLTCPLRIAAKARTVINRTLRKVPDSKRAVKGAGKLMADSRKLDKKVEPNNSLCTQHRWSERATKKTLRTAQEPYIRSSQEKEIRNCRRVLMKESDEKFTVNCTS
ncbi:hypothetical protein K3495_g7092 [Podosphaera aphanis]|nr:hypothetical protein K3495_g7092 [Podosphaera aphanis]